MFLMRLKYGWKWKSLIDIKESISWFYILKDVIFKMNLNGELFTDEF